MTRLHLRFARATLQVLSRTRPALGGRWRLRGIPSGPSQANILLRARQDERQLVLKIRADPDACLEREAWALHKLQGDAAPGLLARADTRDLLTQAVRHRQARLARSLDQALGGVLVMQWLPGRPPSAPLSESQMTAVARALAALHQRRPRGGPRSPLAADPRAVLRTIEESLAQLIAGPLPLGPRRRLLGRALTHCRRHVDRSWRRATHPPIQRLCHGDLRWHNMLCDRGQLRLIDFEWAGLGDPAVDLALMVHRTPLSNHDELRLLDAYLSACQDRYFAQRYFVLRPLIGLSGALGALLDLDAVVRGERRTRIGPQAYLDQRGEAILAQVDDNLRRMALSPPQTRGTLSAPTTVEPKPTRRSGQIAIDGRGASLKSPLGLALAQGLGFTFVDAGSIFRFAALLSHMDRLNLRRRDHRTILLRRLARRHFDFDDDGALLVDGQRHDGVLQTPAIERSVARVAAYVEVQSQVNGIVRALIPRHGVVVVGRHPTPTLLDRCTWLICVSDNPDTRAQRLGQRSGLSVGQAQRCLRDRDRRDHRRSGGAWQADRYLELRLDEDSMQRQVSRLIQQWRRR